MSARRVVLLPAAVYAAVACVFVLGSPEALAWFPLDDAWIHRVYARSLAFGHGFAYNATQEAGCTSPLWVVLTAPAQWLEPLADTGAVVVGVKLVGLALGASAVAAVYRVTARALDRRWLAAAAAAVFAAEPVLAFSSLAGMETTLVVALWLWTVDSLQAGRHRRALVLVGLLPMARPEAVVLSALAIGWLVARREAKALATPWSVAVVAPALAWACFCLGANGHPLPTTFYVKGGLHPGNLALLPAALVQRGWSTALAVPLCGLVGLVAWAARAPDRRSAHALGLLALGSVSFVGAVVVTRSYSLGGYYWTRWTDPGVLGLAAATAIGLALGVDLLIAQAGRGGAEPARATQPGARAARLGLAACALALVGSLPALLASIGERADRLRSNGRVIERLNSAPGRWLAAHTAPDAVVAVNDAGALRYFGQRETIDLIGLNSSYVAFGRVPAERLLERVTFAAIYPVMVRTHPALRRFAVMARFEIAPAENTLFDGQGPSLVVIGQRPPEPASRADPGRSDQNGTATNAGL